MMQRGRRIAFDYGDVRIGVAVSDPDSILSSPLITLKASEKNLGKQISEILSEIEPVVIYVGRPALLSGNDGVATDKAMEFVALLGSITQIPIEMIDERMSTISAARNLREAGRTAKDSKNAIDMAAAVAILDFAIEIEKRK
ncbi:MAG: Holliday junction resolvase RuvX [Actinomycetes bacterium]|jgi:putative Holliday junction resolvase